MSKEEPMTSGGVVDTLKFVRRNGGTEPAIQLDQQNACNGISLRECLSLFDQFECLHLSIFMSNVSDIHSNDTSTSQTS